MFFKCLFIYFERERERESKGGAERGRKNPKQTPTVRVEPNAGLELMNHELMT